MKNSNTSLLAGVSLVAVAGLGYLAYQSIGGEQPVAVTKTAPATASVSLDEQLAAAAAADAKSHKDWEGNTKGPTVPFNWFYEKMANKDGIIDYDAMHEAIFQTRDMIENPTTSFQRSLNELAWEFKGPMNVGGRVTDIDGDEANPKKFYVASASGGILKTMDGGKTYEAMFDDIPIQGMGAVQVDPNNSDIVYAGTGEPNPGGGSIAYGGRGVYKSVDGGKTWTLSGLEGTSVIGRIRINPKNTNVILVAATGYLYKDSNDRGIYRSEDAGKTWTKTLFVDNKSGGIDLDINPDNPDIVIASTWERWRRPGARKYGGKGSAVWRSTDGGKTFSKVTKGLPSEAMEHGRIGVAIAHSNPSTVFAVYSNVSGSHSGLYRSTDGGESFSKFGGKGLNGVCNGFCWWFGKIHVNPHDEKDVWFDAVSKYRSRDGGSSFSRVAAGHADHHAMWWPLADKNFVVEGNDGGIYTSTNGGSSFTHEKTPNTQFYAIEVHEESNRLFGGTQDNGTQMTKGGVNDYRGIVGGDGFVVRVDPNDSSVWYGESQWGGLVRNGRPISQGLGGRKNWSMPYTFGPTLNGKGNTVIYAGTNKIYRSTNSGSKWTSVSKDLTKGSDGKGGVKYGTVSSIDVSDTDKNVIYAGTDDGRVWVSKDYASSWQEITKGLEEGRWTSRVKVDPKNPAIVYVAQSGFRSDDHKALLWRSTNYGQTWENVAGNLPAATVNDVVVDFNDSSKLFVGTDTGVFMSEDGGKNWGALGKGMPLGVIVHDIKLTKANNLYAGTFGRGMYKLSLGQ